jgi:hypothetical protein
MSYKTGAHEKSRYVMTAKGAGANKCDDDNSPRRPGLALWNDFVQ